MTVIDIKGDVVDNSYGMMYDWFGIDYTSPSKVNDALVNADDEEIVLNIASNGWRYGKYLPYSPIDDS